MFTLFGERKKITEKLYEQNLELAVKNKTLSLLEKLYQKSVLTLLPGEMSREITDVIRQDLNLEIAGILIFQKEDDSIIPLSFSKSERCTQVLNKFGFEPQNTTIKDISRHDFFKQVVYDRQENIADNIEEVWNKFIAPEHLRGLRKELHVKTMLLYPLIKGEEVLGVLLLGLNRDYNTLNVFEKSSIKSFINIIALLLNKAYLYKNLQDSYELEKKAKEDINRAYGIEKKAKEEMEKIDKFKDQFLMTTQHNLRTPLTSMMGYTDLLLKGFFGKQNKKTTEVLQKFQILTQNMIRMVNNFLDMAQFQLGKSVVTLKPGVDVALLIDEIMQELQFKAERKKVYLKFKKPQKVLTISADREKLKAAIFNIVDNAVKYTEKGGVDIEIKNQETVKVIVSDTGIGIIKEKLGTMFEQMFERSEEAKKVSSLGSGVGLYLSGEIIRAHKGKVWAESEGIGKGSTFHIELPLVNNQEPVISNQ